MRSVLFFSTLFLCVLTLVACVPPAEKATGDDVAAEQEAQKKIGGPLAVLPLSNLSGDPEQEYFADAMTEALITGLSKIEDLKVISRSSVARYKGTDKPVSEIAQELGVETVLEGSFLKKGDRVRVTVQLIDATAGQSLWADAYERDLTSILDLQEDIAQTIAQRLQAALTPEAAARKAIRGLDGQWNAAMNAGDYEAIADLFTEDAIRMEADVPAQVGREAILSAMRSDMEEATSESKSVTEEIRLAGDWAVVRGTYEVTVTPKEGGEPVHTTGKWMEVHEKQADGSWKISRSIGNRDAPVPCP